MRDKGDVLRINQLLPLIFALAVAASLPAASRTSGADMLLNAYFPEKKATTTPLNFFGLRFAIDEATTACQTGPEEILSCRTTNDAEIQFEKSAVKSASAAVKLLRHNRKMAWFQKYPGLNQYVEESIKVMGKPTILQQAVYFRFDNINWPVLLRSIIVVINEKTIVSVNTACHVSRWPANIEIVEGIEHSLTISAK